MFFGLLIKGARTTMESNPAKLSDVQFFFLKKATNASGSGKLQLLLHGFCWLSVTVGSDKVSQISRLGPLLKGIHHQHRMKYG